MEIIRNIAPHIFRGYDIRGIYGQDLNENVAYTIGKAFATYILENGNNKCIVGMDNRASSKDLKKALIDGVTSCGVDVVDIGLVTTPMYYYAWEYFNIYSGLMITASHNPKEYNGFKFALDKSGNLYGEKIQQFREYILNCTFKEGQGKIEHKDIYLAYAEYMASNLDLSRKRLKVVVDVGNGTGSVIVKDIFSRLNIDVTYLYDDSDPNFPNHHPDPSVEKNTEDLKKEVLRRRADLGLALDGDADRIGVIDNTGKYIPADVYMAVMLKYIKDFQEQKGLDTSIIVDVKCSNALEDVAKSLKVKFERYRVGNSYIKARIKEDNFTFGGELSGHIFFKDKWPGFDDGIYAGLRLIEALTYSDVPLSELVAKVPKYYSSEEIKIKSTESRKNEIVENVKRYCENMGYNISLIDGVRAEFKDLGWVLVRASQTGPDITLRAEAKTIEDMEKLKDEFMKVVEM